MRADVPTMGDVERIAATVGHPFQESAQRLLALQHKDAEARESALVERVAKWLGAFQDGGQGFTNYPDEYTTSAKALLALIRTP